MSIRASLLAGLTLATVVTGCAASVDPDDVLESADALVVSPAARVGTLTYGQATIISYTASPRYRAYSFVATAGDAIDVSAKSADGDPVLWLTNASFNTLEKNDDAIPGNRDARIQRTLKKGGTYWIVVAEAKRSSSTIEVSLAKDAPAPPPPPPAPSTFACPNQLGDDCVTLAGVCYDHYACPVQGFLDSQGFAGGTFHFDGERLWPLPDQSTSGSMAGDETNAVFFREHHSVTVDGQERGIASTLRNNDVYVKATREAAGIEMTVRYVPRAGGFYQNSASCSLPRTRGVGGFCKFHATLP